MSFFGRKKLKSTFDGLFPKFLFAVLERWINPVRKGAKAGPSLLAVGFTLWLFSKRGFHATTAIGGREIETRIWMPDQVRHDVSQEDFFARVMYIRTKESDNEMGTEPRS